MQAMVMNRKVAFRGSWVVALCILLAGVAVSLAAPATNRYVVKNNPLAAPPYDSLANAAPDIQTAVDAAVAANGDMVLVAAGVYDTGGTEALPTYWGLTNRVVINKTITVRSLDNDPATTIIEGAWDPATNGTAAIRGVYLATGATLAGFTVRNGATVATLRSLESNRNQRGGGVFCVGVGSMISNCVIANNSSYTMGGGVSSGTILDSLIVSNRCVVNGGGIYGSVLTRCTVSHNQGTGTYGGGGNSVTASNCVFRYNEALGGGAVSDGTLYNCLMYGNVAGSSGGGGAAHGNINLYNCTLVGNRVSGVSSGIGGGGIYVRASRTVVAQNCIVYSNEATDGPNIYIATGGTLYITNSCTVPDIPGWADGNITNDPLFTAWGSGFGTNHVAGNYRPRAGSPCIDAGTNGWWTLASQDLDGRARIKDGRVDIGCYEFYPVKGTTFCIR